MEFPVICINCLCVRFSLSPAWVRDTMTYTNCRSHMRQFTLTHASHMPDILKKKILLITECYVHFNNQGLILAHQEVKLLTHPYPKLSSAGSGVFSPFGDHAVRPENIK